RLLPVRALDLTSDEEVERLVGATELHVRADLHGVEALEQRIEELHDADRTSLPVADREVVALEHPSDGVRGGEAEHVGHVELPEPLGVAHNLRASDVDDAAGLLQIGLRVRLHLLRREHRSRVRLAGRVADQSREVADDQDRRMARVLELTELPEHHRVAERQVRTRRIDPELDAERAPVRELFREHAVGDRLFGTREETLEVPRLAHGAARLPAPNGPRARSRHYHRASMKLPRVRAAAAVAVLSLLASACHLPDLTVPQNQEKPLAQTSFLYADDGSLITTLHAGENPVVVPFAKIPEDVRNAVVAVEDKRFYQHRGIDVKAMIRAAFADVSAGRIVEGGS